MRQWNPEKHKGLTRRMACRLKLAVDGKTGTRYALNRILKVGLRTAGRNNYIPAWLKELELAGYDDDWQDWQPSEIQAILDRLQDGHDLGVIREVFRPPERALSKMVAGTQKVRAIVVAIEDGFSADEIADEPTRNFANAQWQEHGQTLDLSQPTNRATVRNMIILEIRMRRLQRDLLDVTKAASEISALQKDHAVLMKAYSDAAEDVSQLERQKENRDEKQTLSLIVERARDIRDDWRRNKTALHMQLEESALIQNMVVQHRVSLEASPERVVQRTGDTRAKRPPTASQRLIEALADREDPKGVVTSVLRQ